MQKITVGFSRPNGWFEPYSWVIRLFTWAPYSHAYIKFYSETYQRWIIYQASGLAVNFKGQIMFDQQEIIVKEYDIPISDEIMASTVQYAIDKCGSPYGIFQAIGMGICLIANIFGIKMKNPFYSGSSFVCSELVGDIIDYVGDGEIDASTATPKDVDNYLANKGFVVHNP